MLKLVKQLFAVFALTLICGRSAVLRGDDLCYELLDGGNCADSYGDWDEGLGTSCVCNQTTQVCTQRIYHDYAPETEWNANRGYYDLAGEGGYTDKEEGTFNCVTSGTCQELCVGDIFIGFSCEKNTPPPNQLFTIDDDSLKGIQCPE